MERESPACTTTNGQECASVGSTVSRSMPNLCAASSIVEALDTAHLSGHQDDIGSEIHVGVPLSLYLYAVIDIASRMLLRKTGGTFHKN